MSLPPAEQQRAARAGRRSLLGLGGALLLVLAAVPLGLLVRSAWSPLVDADLRATAAAEEAVAGSRALLEAARAVTLLGEPLLLTAGALLLALLLWRTGSGRLALLVLAVRAGSLLLSQGLKAAYDRTRPVFDDPVATALGASFPSGHALGAAAWWTLAAVLLLPHVRRTRLVLAAGLLVAVAVAASRVLLGVHYVSDVVAGLLLGTGWTAVCVSVLVRDRADAGRRVDRLAQGVGA